MAAPTPTLPPIKWLSFSHSRNGNRQFYALHADTGEIKNLTNSSEDDWEARWDPDGKHIVFTGIRKGQNGIFIRNLETGEETTVMSSTEGYVDYPSFSKGGRMVSFTGGELERREAHIGNWNTGEIKILTRNHNFVSWTNFTPDGRWPSPPPPPPP